LFEVVSCKLLSWLRPTFKNFNSNSLVEELVVLNLLPVDFGIFSRGRVNEPEFSLVSHVFKTPLNVSLVVIGEGLLVERVAVRHFKNLIEQILLLSRDKQQNIGDIDLPFERVFCVFW
jgi:hypothetical protein